MSTERREYVPIAWMEPLTIPSNFMRISEWADKPLFGLLTSATQGIGWRAATGTPSAGCTTHSQFRRPEGPGQCSSPSRAGGAGCQSGARRDLGRPVRLGLMPMSLRKVHRALDRAEDQLCRRAPLAPPRSALNTCSAFMRRLGHLCSMPGALECEQRLKISACGYSKGPAGRLGSARRACKRTDGHWLRAEARARRQRNQPPGAGPSGRGRSSIRPLRI